MVFLEGKGLEQEEEMGVEKGERMEVGYEQEKGLGMGMGAEKE